MISSYKTEEETGMHVRVEPYNPDWPAAFQREAARLRPVFGKNLVALMMIIQRIAYHIEHGDIVSEQ